MIMKMSIRARRANTSNVDICTSHSTSITTKTIGNTAYHYNLGDALCPNPPSSVVVVVVVTVRGPIIGADTESGHRDGERASVIVHEISNMLRVDHHRIKFIVIVLCDGD